jgi:hypothetical protein
MIGTIVYAERLNDRATIVIAVALSAITVALVMFVLFSR